MQMMRRGEAASWEELSFLANIVWCETPPFVVRIFCFIGTRVFSLRNILYPYEIYIRVVCCCVDDDDDEMLFKKQSFFLAVVVVRYLNFNFMQRLHGQLDSWEKMLTRQWYAIFPVSVPESDLQMLSSSTVRLICSLNVFLFLTRFYIWIFKLILEVTLKDGKFKGHVKMIAPEVKYPLQQIAHRSIKVTCCNRCKHKG